MKLYVLNGEMEGKGYDLKGDSILIGRAPDNDIQINNRSLSRRHAKVCRKGKRFFIEDLNSQNGTWVNGQRITPGQEIELLEGCPIVIGNIFFNLSEEDPLEGMAVEYSISLIKRTDKDGRHLLSKDRRLTERRDLELVYEISGLLMQSLDIHEICQKMMDALMSHFKRMDSGSILLLDHETGELKEIIARSRGRHKNDKSDYSRTIVRRVLRDGRAVIMSDTSREQKEDLSESIEMRGIRSIMCVPLISHSATRGAIYVHSIDLPQGFRKDDLFLLSALSSPAAVAIENALLYAESKSSEEALRKSKERYQHLYNNALIGLYRIAISDGKLIECNERFAHIFGYETQQQIIEEFVVASHYADLKKVGELFEELRKAGEVTDAEIRLKRRDGLNMWAKYSARIYPDEGFVEGFVADITQQKKVEAQLLHAHKMEAIGTLAGGISHDFNNILQIISGYTQMLMLGKDPADAEYSRLAEIERSAQRANDLTKQLLIFSRKVESELRPVDLNKEIVQVTKMLKSTIPKMIDIELHLEDSPKIINADPVQIEQILMNLGVNARDAMPGGGKLMFETSNVTLDELYCKNHLGAVPGEYVKLCVSDTGHGMKKDILEHIFEPFFSTKESGKGTGLGLSMVYGIVKGHKGYITCYSEPLQGATFKIYFPVLKTTQNLQRAEAKRAEKIRGGDETILLVDDEATILNIGQEILQNYGYHCLKAGSGEKAIEIFKTKKDKIDLVLLDLSMPGIGGYNCLERLLETDPAVRVIITSGYSARSKTKETLEKGARGFIEKPYRLDKMLKEIRKVLDKS